jgi:hypothetical protein
MSLLLLGMHSKDGVRSLYLHIILAHRCIGKVVRVPASKSLAACMYLWDSGSQRKLDCS